jgi:hypothetical protein
VIDTARFDSGGLRSRTGLASSARFSSSSPAVLAVICDELVMWRQGAGALDKERLTSFVVAG